MIQKLVTRSEFSRMAGVAPAAITLACSRALAAAVVGKRVDANHPIAVDYVERKLKNQQAPPATGLDALYEEAVAACQLHGKFSVSFIQRTLRIGYDRAKKTRETMATNGLVPADYDPKTGKGSTPAVVDAALAQAVVDQYVAPHVRGHAAASATRKGAAPVDVPEGIPENIQHLADWTLRDVIAKYGTDAAFVDWLKATKEIENVQEKRLRNAEREGSLVSRSLVQEAIIDMVDGAFIRMLTDGAKRIAVLAVTAVKTGGCEQTLEDIVSHELGTFIRPTKTKIQRALKNA